MFFMASFLNKQLFKMIVHIFSTMTIDYGYGY